MFLYNVMVKQIMVEEIKLPRRYFLPLSKYD